MLVRVPEASEGLWHDYIANHSLPMQLVVASYTDKTYILDIENNCRFCKNATSYRERTQLVTGSRQN